MFGHRVESRLLPHLVVLWLLGRDVGLSIWLLLDCEVGHAEDQMAQMLLSIRAVHGPTRHCLPPCRLCARLASAFTAKPMAIVLFVAPGGRLRRGTLGARLVHEQGPSLVLALDHRGGVRHMAIPSVMRTILLVQARWVGDPAVGKCVSLGAGRDAAYSAAPTGEALLAGMDHETSFLAPDLLACSWTASSQWVAWVRVPELAQLYAAYLHFVGLALPTFGLRDS